MLGLISISGNVDGSGVWLRSVNCALLVCYTDFQTVYWNLLRLRLLVLIN